MQNEGYSSNVETSGLINLNARPRRRRGEGDDRHVKEIRKKIVCSFFGVQVGLSLSRAERGPETEYNND